MAVLLCAAFILGLSCLLLYVTAWKAPEPAEKEPFYATLPGVEMDDLPPAKQRAVLARLNLQHCRCDCMRTVASCRNHHRSCSLSEADGREAVGAARRTEGQ